MQYCWKPYCSGDADLVDSWLDASAIRDTGLEDGWQTFYDYWMTESGTGQGKDRCFLIFHEHIPFAVMYLAVLDREMTVSEFVVTPNRRGRGYGTAVLKELLDNAACLLNTEISLAKAVIFPNNIASQKAFEKAGFMLASKQHDAYGDTLNYEYRFGTDR